MSEENHHDRPSIFGLFLRGGLFLLFIRYGGALFAWILNELVGYFAAAALSIFLAAVLASWFVLRTFERGRLEDIGMGWSGASLRHLSYGLAGGMVAGLAALLLPVGARLADLTPSPGETMAFTPGKFLFVTVVLLFGAAGEELMFRGYAFQTLLRRFGPWWVIGPFGLLFAAAHLGNQNVVPMGLFNTALWGVLFGYAFFRTGALWLPIGLHFGWNWMLPLFGVNLSGFQLGLTGYTLVWKAGPLWSGGEYGIEGSVIATVVALVLGLWLHRARFERQAAPLADAPPEA